MKIDRGAKRVYVRECADSFSVGQLQKKSVNAVKDCLKKMFECQASKDNGA